MSSCTGPVHKVDPYTVVGNENQKKTLNVLETSNLNKGGPSWIHLLATIFDWGPFEQRGLVMVFWSVVKNNPYLCTLEIYGVKTCIAPV